jgi:hypothetical protein
VHFDAHYDTYDDFPSWYGVTDSAGHWASRSVHEHHVDAHRSVQIGIRGHGYGEDDGHTSRELGYRIVTQCRQEDHPLDHTGKHHLPYHASVILLAGAGSKQQVQAVVRGCCAYAAQGFCEEGMLHGFLST